MIYSYNKQMKPYKIITVVSANDAERRSMLRRAVIACGLAKVPSNAEHLIKESIDEVDYDSAYVVVVDNFRFNGLAVIVGTKAVPARYEWITQTLY